MMLPTILAPLLTTALSLNTPTVTTDIVDMSANQLPHAQAHITTATQNVPIVVLGARLQPNCTPPKVLNERLDAAANFARLHPTNTIIVSGGATQAGCPTEAQAMEVGLRARLIPNPIVRDDHAFSTVENARNVAALAPGQHQMVLITSDYHLPRAQANFHDRGINTIGVGA